MATFDELQSDKDFLVLHGQRAAALVKLNGLKVVLEALPKDNPSVLALSRNEAKIDSCLEKLEEASDAVSDLFGRAGGDYLNDEDFKTYCDEETTIM